MLTQARPRQSTRQTALVAEEVRDFVEALRPRVRGEVRFDPYSRVLYATDASPYQILPLGVVIPRDEADVLATVELAARYQVPILPRGAGTSLSGQAVGRAVVIDFSKHLNRVLEINPEERWVRAQPGAVLDLLNQECRPLGLQFAPDPATASRCTLGGMIANNSSGAHSILYRKTIDHTLALRVAFADGEAAWLEDLSGAALERELEAPGLKGQGYRAVRRLAEAHRDEIEARYPKIMRRVAGYNLDEFILDQPFNLSKIIVGSEGTLATILEARLNLVETPPGSAVMVVHFASLYEALDAVNPILETGPSAVELLDEVQIRMARESLEFSRRMSFVEGEPRTLLIVEYYSPSPADLAAKLDDLEARLRRAGAGYAYARALSEEAKADVWRLRKAGLGLFLAMKGDAKPVSFIEDAAVPVERLPEYIRRVHGVLAELGLECGHYGHASVGLLHLRPIVNLKRPDHIDKIHTLSERVTDILLEMGGAMSGEHGDGLARSMWNEKMFGPVLYQAFRELKQAIDPQGVMNPGKIVDAQDLRQNLRYGPAYRARIGPALFRYQGDGSQEAHVEACAGVGECRKTTGGTMCPSYMVTMEEEHSTRGRANALRAAMSGLLPPSELYSERMYQVLDLCVECKGCKGECPTNVDMAKLKYEFLHRYYQHHRLPLRARLFGHIHALSRLGSATAPVSNWAASSPLGRMALARLGVAPERRLPPFARETLEAWYRRTHSSANGAQAESVVLFHDTFTTYNYPQVGVAAVRLLEAAGFRVLLAEGRVCCGRPMISKGLLDTARANARRNLAALAPYVERGYPIVGLEPSCLLTFRDEYLDFLEDAGAKALARQSYLLEEFLLQHEDRFRPLFRERAQQVLLHGHCHQKAHVGAAPSARVLGWIPGTTVQVVDSGCCGMAGSFGFEAEHFAISLQMGERRLFPAVRQHPGPVVAAGVSCRQQIQQGTGRRALHLAEALAAAL